MAMILTPAKRPPAPENVTGFSADAQKIWNALLKKSKKSNENFLENLYRDDQGYKNYYQSIYESTFGDVTPHATVQNLSRRDTSDAVDVANSLFDTSIASSESVSEDFLGSKTENRKITLHKSLDCENLDASIGHFDLLASQFSSKDVDQASKIPFQKVKSTSLQMKNTQKRVNNAQLPEYFSSYGKKKSNQMQTNDLDITSSPPLDLSPTHESYFAISQCMKKTKLPNTTNSVENSSHTEQRHSNLPIEQPTLTQVFGYEAILAKRTEENRDCIKTGNDLVEFRPINAATGIETPKESSSMCITTPRNRIASRLSEISSINVSENKIPIDSGKLTKPSSFFDPYKKHAGNQNGETPIANKHQDKSSSNGQTVVILSDLPQDEVENLTDDLSKLDEVALTLVYTDKSSQLRESATPSYVENLAVAYAKRDDENAKKKLFCVLIPLSCQDNKSNDTINARNCVEVLMKGTTRKLCFEAQETMKTIIEHFEFHCRRVMITWRLFDPKIGLWLLDPDHSVTKFSEVLQKLDISRNTERKGWKEELTDDLALLAQSMMVVHSRLVKDKLWWLFEHIETPLVSQLACMETRSIQISVEEMIKSGDILRKKLKVVEQQAHKSAGLSFNVNSHHQLRDILFEKLKLGKYLTSKKGSKTAQGSKSTSEAVLQQLQDHHPLPKIILQYRQLHTLLSTFVEGMLTRVRNDHQLFTHWDQTSAATGRLTSCNPNIQAIPKQSIEVEIEPESYMIGKETVKHQIYARAPFVSRERYSLLAADFRQIELRLLAHLSAEESLLSLFNKNPETDVFTDLTCLWLSKKPDAVTHADREQTKRVVYSVMYGVGKDRLASYLNTSPTEAQALMQSFMVAFPGVGYFTRACVTEAKMQGFQTTIFGRRRLFPHILHANYSLRAQAERQAVNFCIQGSAADLCKAAMLKVEEALGTSEELNDVHLLYQIHDEIVLHVPDQCLNDVARLVKKIMEDKEILCGKRVSLKVPLLVSISHGKSWAHFTPVT